MLSLGMNAPFWVDWQRRAGWAADGAALDLDFVRNRAAVDGLASSIGQAIDFSRASPGWAFDEAGALKEFARDVPRVTDLGLLTEASKTNLFRYSDNVAGLASVLNIASRTATDIVENTATGEHTVFDPVTLEAGQVYTICLEFQPIGARDIRFGFLSSVTGGTSTRTSFSGETGLPLGPTLYTETSAQVLADGWIRICATMPESTATGAQNLFIQPVKGETIGYAGDGVSGLRLRRIQVEAGRASSPIRTNGSAAVRSADMAERDLSGRDLSSGFYGVWRGSISDWSVAYSRIFEFSGGGDYVTIETAETGDRVRLIQRAGGVYGSARQVLTGWSDVAEIIFGVGPGFAQLIVNGQATAVDALDYNDALAPVFCLGGGVGGNIQLNSRHKAFQLYVDTPTEAKLAALIGGRHDNRQSCFALYCGRSGTKAHHP